MATKPKCPVCDWEVKDDGVQVRHDARVILVCCDECAEKVRKDPTKYIKQR